MLHQYFVNSIPIVLLHISMKLRVIFNENFMWYLYIWKVYKDFFTYLADFKSQDIAELLLYFCHRFKCVQESFLIIFLKFFQGTT